MANQELIEEIINEKAFNQVEKLKNDLGGLEKALVDNIIAAEKFNKILSGASGLKDFDKKAEAARQAILKTQLAEEKLSQSRIRTAQIEEQIAAKRQLASDKQAKKDAERTAALEKQTKTIISNSQAEVDAYNNTANGSREVTETLNAQDKAYAEVTSGLKDNTKAVEENNNSGKQTLAQRRQGAFLLEEERQNLRRSNTELRLQVREANAVKGSLEQRRAALIRLNTVYDNQSPQERASASGQRLQRIIGGLTEQVSGLESATGRNQRNVGNYASALGKAFNGLKTIANILPGIGVAGLIGFAVDPIIEYIQQLDVFKRTAKELITDTALDDSSYKKAISDVNQLGTAIDEFKSGVISSNDVLRIYNDGIGQTAGQLKNVTDVEDFYNSKASAFIQAMFLRAQANASLQIATEKLIASQKRAAGDTTYIDYLKSAGNAALGLFTGQQTSIDAVIRGADLSKTIDTAKLAQEAKEAFKVFADLQKQSDAFNKKNGLNLNGPGKTGPKSKVNTDAIDAQRAEVEAERNKQKAIAEDEQASFDERISAVNNFYNLSEQLNRLDAQKKLKEGKAVSVVEKQRILDDANSEIETNKIRFKILEDDRKAYLANLRKLGEQGTADRIEQLSKEQELIQGGLSQSLIEQARFYSQGKIDEKEYADAKFEIQRKYQNQSIDLEIKSVQDIIDIKKKYGLDTDSEEKALSDLRNKRVKNDADFEIHELERTQEKRKELIAKQKELGLAVFNLGVSIVDAGFENQKNRIQEESDLADQKAARDIENINNSVLSEEDKANKIAIINAQSESRKRVFEARQREIDQRKARFDKAVAISKIIYETASAVVEALPNVPLAFLIGSIGAVQLATALATPIPKYFKGTNSSKGGIAMTDEGGPELYLPPSGNAYLGSDTPNFKNLKAGTKIIPHSKLVRMMAKPELVSAEAGSRSDEVLALIGEQRQSNKLLKTIASKSSKTGFTPRAWFSSQNEMSEINGYLKRNFGRN